MSPELLHVASPVASHYCADDHYGTWHQQKIVALNLLVCFTNQLFAARGFQQKQKFFCFISS